MRQLSRVLRGGGQREAHRSLVRWATCSARRVRRSQSPDGEGLMREGDREFKVSSRRMRAAVAKVMLAYLGRTSCVSAGEAARECGQGDARELLAPRLE